MTSVSNLIRFTSFEQWSKHYGKVYRSQEEKDKRKIVWEQNLEMIKQHNKDYYDGKHCYRIKQTRFSDQVFQKRGHELVGGFKEGVGSGGNSDSHPPDQRSLDTPECAVKSASVNWRERGHVNLPRDQEDLPACWIFAAVSAVESHNSITNGDLVELSVQQLVDCIPFGDKDGDLAIAFDCISAHGSIREKEYPQSAPFKRSDKCKSEGKKVAVKLKEIKTVHNSEEDLETAVHHGPVAATLKFYNFDQQKRCLSTNYEDVYYDPTPDGEKQEILHAVLVIGYGSQPNKDKTGIDKYWIIKNSWGRDKDDENSGFHKIAKNKNNHCGIESNAMYPIVHKI